MRPYVGDTLLGDTTRFNDLLNGDPRAFRDAGVGDVLLSIDDARTDVFFLIDSGSMGVATGLLLCRGLGVASVLEWKSGCRRDRLMPGVAGGLDEDAGGSISSSSHAEESWESCWYRVLGRGKGEMLLGP